MIELEEWDLTSHGGFYFAYFLMDLGPVQMASARVFTTSGDTSSGGGVSPCTKSAVRLLIGH